MLLDKANKILGTVYRTLAPTNQEPFSILYITLVRPILEYAAPVWCLYLVKDILALEKVQRRASLHLDKSMEKWSIRNVSKF